MTKFSNEGQTYEAIPADDNVDLRTSLCAMTLLTTTTLSGGISLSIPQFFVSSLLQDDLSFLSVHQPLSQMP
jgi:hypothetical protein